MDNLNSLRNKNICILNYLSSLSDSNKGSFIFKEMIRITEDVYSKKNIKKLKTIYRDLEEWLEDLSLNQKNELKVRLDDLE